MNKRQKKDVAAIVSHFEDYIADLEAMLDELQETIDNVPENLQGTERYETMEDERYMLEEFKDAIENACTDIRDNLIDY